MTADAGISELVKRARAFALAAHGDQRYGDQPYAVHLDAVAELARPYGEDARVVAYLHDVVEDTAVPLEAVRAEFGDLAADCVALVTDAPGVDRNERKIKTNKKLSQVQGLLRLALIVKAADRLANLRACRDGARVDKLAMYRAEHRAFRAAAFRAGLCDDLWTEIDAIAG
jgi:(p)ppGpp synthase/HD superfamily hydrolase